MADYKHQDPEFGGVIRYADGAGIPNDPGNRDWRAYQEYVAAGGVTDPWQTTQEANQAAYDGELSKTTTEQRKVNEILQLDATNATNGMSTLDPTDKANIQAYGHALDVHRQAVIAAGPGAPFPAFPVYPGGEVPDAYVAIYGG